MKSSTGTGLLQGFFAPFIAANVKNAAELLSAAIILAAGQIMLFIAGQYFVGFCSRFFMDSS